MTTMIMTTASLAKPHCPCYIRTPHDGNTNKTTYKSPHKHPSTMAYPSLYGIANSTNSITTITTVQFLFGMEPHTHTDIVYDDEDDDDTNNAYDYDKYGTVYDYTYGDSFNMNDPSVRSQF